VLKSKQSGEIMRDAKFRGYSKEHGWLYGNLSREKNGNPFIYDGFSSTGYPVDPDSVGQFTEILDMEGNEIYENDCVIDENEPGVARIVYEGGCFITDNTSMQSMKPLTNRAFVVVGNTTDGITNTKGIIDGVTNMEEFKKLRKRYKELSKNTKTIKSARDFNESWTETKEHLTGFSRLQTCILCTAVYDHYVQDAVCQRCVWYAVDGMGASCNGPTAGKTFDAISKADTVEDLQKAYKDRAKLMKKVIKWIDNFDGEPFKE